MSAARIAIVGMSCRLPGAPDLDSYWRNIRDGVDSISRFSLDELEIGIASRPDFDPDGYVCARGLLDDVESFDNAFFGYLPRDAELTDPQQRVFLELCWQAMEHAGHDVQRLDRRVGVFAGSYLNSYLLANLCSDPAFLQDMVDRFQSGGSPVDLGNDKDYLATRVAFKLGLRGPAMAVQCACSTSLVAIATACASIEAGQCDMALAGGVTIVLPQRRGYRYRDGGMASPDGVCRSFDSEGAGTVFGNGAGVVVLKRLDAAVADGDTIYAVIRGFAVNNDGSRKASYTAPTIEGQAEVISQALAMSGFDARSIGYVETHGTATPLGDPIEIAGLSSAFRADTADSGYCALGSVKANIGHMDVAAGVAGLIKAALVVHHGLIPPLIHFNKPNPRIDLASSPFYVPTEASPWPADTGPRRAAVSAFGVGGTNAHLQLESWQPEAATPAPAQAAGEPGGGRVGAQLLLLSARTEAALAASSERLADHLEAALAAKPTLSLADTAFTLQLGRRQFDRRRIVVAADPRTAIEGLRRPAPTGTARTVAANRPQIVFMFPGQGAQYPGMARALYQREALFRETIERCAQALLDDPESRLDIRTWLLAERADEALAAEMMATAVAQPTLFALEIALARLLLSWGIQPVALVGHSVGELAAVTLAGMLPLEEAIRFVAARGRLMQSMPPGRMAVVRRDAREIETRLPEGVTLAAINAPGLSVVSGSFEAVDRFLDDLAAEGIQTSILKTSHAFHSPMMAPAAEALRARFPAAACQPLALDIASTSLGRVVDREAFTEASYWSEQMLNPVRFAEALTAAAGNGRRIFIEVGPRQTLGVLATESLAEVGALAIESLQQGSEAHRGEDQQLAAALGRLWMAGVAVDWSALHDAGRQRLPLPGYPFERKRLWIDRGQDRTAAAAIPAAAVDSRSPGELLQQLPAQAAAIQAAIASLASAAATVDADVAEVITRQIEVMQAQLKLLLPALVGQGDSGGRR